MLISGNARKKRRSWEVTGVEYQVIGEDGPVYILWVAKKPAEEFRRLINGQPHDLDALTITLEQCPPHLRRRHSSASKAGKSAARGGTAKAGSAPEPTRTKTQTSQVTPVVGAGMALIRMTPEDRSGIPGYRLVARIESAG